MRRFFHTIGVAWLLSAVAGCGTFVNMADPTLNTPSHPEQRIYGGVTNDFEVLWGAVNWNSNFTPAGRPLGFISGIVDLPLSIVADTLTLPWTIRHQIEGPSTPPQSNSAPTAVENPGASGSGDAPVKK